MTEPHGLTGKFEALVQRHGALMVIYVFLRTYWKAVAGVGGSLIAFGVFVNKFNTLIDGQKAHTDAIVQLTIRVGAVEKAEEKRSLLEQAIGEAAHITVTPQNAPQEAPAQGKIKR